MKQVIIFMLLITATPSFGQKNEEQADTLKYCVGGNGVGAGGYDVVSYFQADNPLTGRSEFAVDHDGVTYLFFTEANKRKFLKNPVQYQPQYGGWCSMTLVMGRATTPTYDNFAILSGKLYLFERTLSVNGRELWLMDPMANEQTAIQNYRAYVTTGKIK